MHIPEKQDYKQNKCEMWLKNSLLHDVYIKQI